MLCRIDVGEICKKIGNKASTLEVHGNPRTPWYMGMLTKAAEAFLGPTLNPVVKFPWSPPVYPVLGDRHSVKIATLRLLFEVSLSFLFLCYVVTHTHFFYFFLEKIY